MKKQRRRDLKKTDNLNYAESLKEIKMINEQIVLFWCFAKIKQTSFLERMHLFILEQVLLRLISNKYTDCISY